MRVVATPATPWTGHPQRSQSYVSYAGMQPDSLDLRFGRLAPEEKAALKKFRQLTQRLWALESTMALGRWDMYAHLPKAGQDIRGQMAGELDVLAHEIKTSPEMEQLVRDLSQPEVLKKLPAKDRHILKRYQEELQTVRKIPGELLQKITLASGKGYSLWDAAINGNQDFRETETHLTQMIALTQKKLKVLPPTAHPYNHLLHIYAPGVTVGKMDQWFGTLKPALLDLVDAISRSPVKAAMPMARKPFYPLDKQQQFIQAVLKDMGYDFAAGEVARVSYPLQESMGAPFDVRVGVTLKESNWWEGFFGAVHEGGHALYEQGVDPKLAGSALATGPSIACHESQSLLYENMVSKSKAFLSHYWPQLQQLFPAQFAFRKEPGQNQTDMFARWVNTVKPGRVWLQADEVMFNLHILLRYELERDLFAGKLKPAQLKQAWNDKAETYLGGRPQNDAEGMLQDSHWPEGLFGYFPAYTVGFMAAAQIYRAAEKALSKQFGQNALNTQMGQGNFAPFRQWLKENIHRHGATKSLDELLKQATGEPLNPQHAIAYLWQKYAALYQLEIPPQIQAQFPKP